MNPSVARFSALALAGAVTLLSGCGTTGDSSGSNTLGNALGGFNVGGVNVGAAVGAASKANDAMRDITEPEEIEMGRSIAAGVLGAAPLVKNDAQQKYVNDVGRWLSLHSERPDLPWHFAVIDADTVNAFAAPGGYIFVSRGLVERMHSEAELAGVLAHEISHVVHKDHLNDIRKNAQKGLILDLASLKGGGLTGEAARAVARVGLEGYVRGLSREDELAADRLGVVIAARAGYDPYGLVVVLQTLAAMPASDSALTLFLATHPAPSDRVAALEAAMPPSFEQYAKPNPALARYSQIFKK